MNIAPKARFLYSLRAERGDIVRVCSEAVDNSFDASARNVIIEISDQEIRFIDDGDGVLFKNFPALFTYGDHVELSGTKLGRFGVGIFVQALNTADVMEVQSISRDGRFGARVNWRTVINRGFDVDDPAPLPFVVGTGTGTVIRLATVRRLRPYTTDSLMDALAQRFYPAIADGCTIQINGVMVPTLVEPRMVDVVDRRFDFGDGRTAILHAGLLANPSRLNRVHIGFGHRVIKSGCTWGCGSYTGLGNMFARVQLVGGGWSLSAFKDDLFKEEQRDELEDAIEDAITPILMKCRDASIEARVANVGELINAMLPPDLVPARPKRKKQEQKPSADRKAKKGGEVDVDKSEPNGPAKAKRPQKDRLLITWEGKDAKHGIGWFEPGRINRVHLSPDNPKITELFQQKDNKFVALALLIIAVSIFEHGREAASAQKMLDMSEFAFGIRVAQHLATNAEVVFKPAIA